MAEVGDANKRTVQRIFDQVISKGDLTLANELIDPAFVDHDDRQPQGLDGFKHGLTAVRKAFPDWTSTIEDMVCEGDTVGARWVVRGTHRGPFFGIHPTGRTITMREAGMLRLRGGKLVEVWRVADQLSLLRQLGAMPEEGRQP